ncbi:nudC domain-containing protein 3 isoform X2 [Nematostella vectensis]|uniref:nudC domain-containing protein 3 isoform X2 n=1 Tax=Nematostella vectensis TaxID=45351 RepID=UPI00138FA40E|nr:nudC domain-containing protein 3 isoform X2 [Nematostella vectensis]
MAATSQYDNVFLGILQNCTEIKPFLEAIFSFLARRTDFFRVMTSESDKMGFPPGVAENMVRSPVNEGPSSGAMHEEAIPVGVESTVEVTTSEEQEETGSTTAVTSNTSTSSSDAAGTDMERQQNDVSPSFKNTSSSTQDESKGLLPGTQPDCYNGAALEDYVWAQTIHDIDIKVPVPSCVKKARDVGVEIKNSSLKVFLKGSVPPDDLKKGSTILVDGQLQRHVKCEECMWSLEPGKCVAINLEKTEERFWTTVIKGDPEIDRTKIDTTRDIHDFDEQTQTDYEQVMYDYRQKQMGKPTVKEQQTHEMLKKAWNAKGSPFAGTPFDPSKLNIS